MKTYEREIRSISDNLGLENEVAPKREKYVGIAVFGAAAQQMKRRLEYAKELVDERKVTADALYLLCGERFADKSVDGGEAYLKSIALENGISEDQVTETHLMLDAYKQIKGEDAFSKIPLHVIDAPKGNNSRPMTADTLRYLAKEFPLLEGDLLFVSKAPYIRLQTEDTYSVLGVSGECLPKVIPEVVGGSAEGTILNRLMGAFSFSLYAGYSRVARALGATNSKEELEALRNKFNFDAQMTRLKQASQNVLST